MQAQGVNVHVWVYSSYVHIHPQIFTKMFVLVHYCHRNFSFKSNNDPIFCCRDIYKMKISFCNHQFSMYFSHFHRYALQKFFKCRLLRIGYGILGSLISKWTKLRINLTHSPSYQLISILCDKCISLLNTLYT